MAGFAKTKRVTDPFDDRVKARIFGRDRCEPVSVSSGSEHSGDAEDDDASPSLSDLVYDFLTDDGAGAESPKDESDSECDRVGYEYDSTHGIEESMNTVLRHDSFGNVLLANVLKAVAVCSRVNTNKQILRRNVMAVLRDFGYNATICKTKWESSGGLTAGNYEFIDVIRSDSYNHHTRYFVDLDFAGEFEIARPTAQYDRLLKSLPNIFVAKNEELKQIAKVMSNAAKRSLKSRSLSVPPWRKNRFMQNKWLGPYRRTANLIPGNSSSSLPTQSKQGFTVICRPVGFNSVSDRQIFPAATRTR